MRFRPFFHDLQVSIMGDMINLINNHLDQLSAHPLLFNFNGLNSSFKSHCLSIRECNMETSVYAGDRSSGCVYDPTYMGKAKLARVYAALYMTVMILSRAQVHEQDFERVLAQKMVSPGA